MNRNSLVLRKCGCNGGEVLKTINFFFCLSNESSILSRVMYLTSLYNASRFKRTMTSHKRVIFTRLIALLLTFILRQSSRVLNMTSASHQLASTTLEI